MIVPILHAQIESEPDRKSIVVEDCDLATQASSHYDQTPASINRR